MSLMGQKLRSEGPPAASGPPQRGDISEPRPDFAFGPQAAMAYEGG